MSDFRIVGLRRLPSAFVAAFWTRVNDVIDSGGRNALVTRASQAEMLVRLYYVYLMVASYGRINETTNAWARDSPVHRRLDLALTSWIPLDTWREIAVGCAVLMLAMSMLAAMIPRWRGPRIIAICSFLLTEAMGFDEAEKISHAAHPVVWVGIAFCFLPSLKNDSSEHRRTYLATFFGAQVLMCLLYTCAGLTKVIGIAYDWHEGVTWLNPEALPLLFADKWRGSHQYLAAAFFLSNPWASWLSSVGVLYLEVGALFAVFRPHLHRPLALGLLLMHAAILVAMRIVFRPSAFIVGLLLLCSPFAPAKLQMKETILDLPVVRCLYQWFKSRTAAAAHGDRPGTSSGDAPWIPSSRVMKLWIPVFVVAYLCVAYGNLDKRGRSASEIYPVSAMPMFMRIDSSQENVRKLARIRSQPASAKERRKNAINNGRDTR